MPKGRKRAPQTSPYESLEAWKAWQSRPGRKGLNAAERRDLRAADIQLFAKQCGRKAHAGHDPNDRSYSRKAVETVRHMKPELFDELLRDGED